MEIEIIKRTYEQIIKLQPNVPESIIIENLLNILKLTREEEQKQKDKELIMLMLEANKKTPC